MPTNVDLHRRPTMRPDPVSGLWVESQTLGVTSTSSTGSAFGGTMTCQVQLAMDCNVSEVLYTLSQAGTYRLDIDGATIDTVTTGGAGTHNVIANVTPIRVTRGPHEFKLTKTAGSSGWNFAGTFDGAGFAPWLTVGYWQEASGGETPPLKLTVVDTPRPMLHQYATVTGVSGTSRVHAAQFFTWKRPVQCVGVITGMNGPLASQYQAAVDGVIRGQSKAIPLGAANYPAGIITFDRPAVFLPGDVHYIDVTNVAGVGWGGPSYLSQGGWVSDDWLSQGPWLNPGGTTPTTTCLLLGWLINPLGP